MTASETTMKGSTLVFSTLHTSLIQGRCIVELSGLWCHSHLGSLVGLQARNPLRTGGDLAANACSPRSNKLVPASHSRPLSSHHFTTFNTLDLSLAECHFPSSLGGEGKGTLHSLYTLTRHPPVRGITCLYGFSRSVGLLPPSVSH